MCGVAGIIQLDGSRAAEGLVRDMTDRLVHRGPDASGLAPRGPVAFGHRRLSIIDVSGGSQPMETTEGDICVTFNGEIYNFPDIREDLEKRGHRFRTGSDTEILLALWRNKGVEMVHDLWGMFAFAIHDRPAGKVFLAVDRYGQKPLYHRTDGSRFAFASEPGALRVLDGPWTLDRVSVHHYLSLLAVPCPRTVWKEVNRLSGGHRILIDLESGTQSEDLWYHHPGGGRFDGDRHEARERLINLLRDATRRRLMSEVPLGAFLSGGVDSAVTVSLMQEILGKPVDTFTIRLEEGRWDESDDARLAAEHLGTRHHVKTVSPCDPDLFMDCVAHLGEPFADSSFLPTSLVSAHAREHVTVALSGDAADEAFGGYERYRAMLLTGTLDKLGRGPRNALMTMLRLLPAGREERTLTRKVRRFADIAIKDGLERYVSILSQFDEAGKAALYTDPMAEATALASTVHVFEADFARSRARDMIDQVMNLDLNRYLQDDILVKVDRASMWHSLEVRSPFLDHRVQEFASGLPVDWKVNVREGKIILKEAFEDRLPPGHFRRPKRGFALPLGNWFRGPMKDMMLDLTTGPNRSLDGIVDPDAVGNLIDDHLAGRLDHGQKIWALCVLAQWMRHEGRLT